MAVRFKKRLPAIVEPLELRRLFDVELVQYLPPVLADVSNPSNDQIDVSKYLENPDIPGTVAKFEFASYTSLFGSTHEAEVDVALTDSATPITVQNFLNYVDSGEYNGTFINRAVVLSNPIAGGSPSAPADIVQGGSDYLDSTKSGTEIEPIATASPIEDEVSSEVEGNVTGTIAMAKTSQPNSATDGWFFNVHDNPGLDDPSNAGGFTTFGHIIGNGLSVIDKIAALNTADITTGFEDVPIAGSTPTPQNLIYVGSITTVAGMTYTVTSDNNSVVRASISGSELSFVYLQPGTAQITITGNSYDGSTGYASFSVTVPDTTQPGEGATAVDDTPAPIVVGTTTSLKPLLNDTDSLAPLLDSDVNIVTPPVDGTATVDTTTGYISYVPNPGFIGSDSLQYNVTDQLGNISNTATIHISVVPAAATVTIGTATARSLSYTEPDGTVAKLSIVGGTALVTFASYDVTISSPVRGVVSASGSGATLANIAVTDTNIARPASVTLTAKGGTDGEATLGGLTSTGGIANFIAPTTALTGDVQVSGLSVLELASVANSTMLIGPQYLYTSFLIPTVTDTTINKTGSSIKIIRSKSWTNSLGTTDPDVFSITANAILTLATTGDFDNSLTLSGSGLDLNSAAVGGQVLGSWNITGVVGNLVLGSAANSWSMITDNLVHAISIGGNFTGNISAGAIRSILLKGNVTNSQIETRANYQKGYLQLGSLVVDGTLSSSTIDAAGNIGAITARSLDSVQIDAGVSSSVYDSSTLPTSLSDFDTVAATLGVVKLLAPTATFSNSKISAGAIGTLSLGQIVTSNSQATEGIAAKSIGAIIGSLDSGGVLRLSKAQLKSAAVLAAYITSKNFTLNDFDIELLTS